jgi:isopentenyl diphosphate isomerase/L-lactate dehydrogenase-like FMN-dependent dehydrogenase
MKIKAHRAGKKDIKMITWNTSKEDYKVINEIVERAKNLGVKRDTLDLDMDICAAHENCPLRLEDFLKADDFNFLHDVYGIISNLNRETGELENCFLPRFAR